MLPLLLSCVRDITCDPNSGFTITLTLQGGWQCGCRRRRRFLWHRIRQLRWLEGDNRSSSPGPNVERGRLRGNPRRPGGRDGARLSTAACPGGGSLPAQQHAGSAPDRR